MLLAHALVLSASQFVHKTKSLRIYCCELMASSKILRSLFGAILLLAGCGRRRGIRVRSGLYPRGIIISRFSLEGADGTPTIGRRGITGPSGTKAKTYY